MKITRFDPNQGDPAIPITGSGSSSSSIAAHLADAIDAHDASAISIVDAGGFYTGTDVEAALQEAEQDIADHLADAIDAHDASAVSIVDTGAYYTGTEVEAALQEIGADLAGGIPTNLDDLADVTITSPAAKDVLRYSGTLWVNDAAIWRPVMDGLGNVVTDGATGEAIMALSP